MIPLKKNISKYPDLFLQERSATKRLSVLLGPDYHKCTLQELNEKVVEILNLEDTIVSEEKKKQYIDNFKKQKSVQSFQIYLANILFKGSNLTL